MPPSAAYHLRRVPTRSSATGVLSYLSPIAEIMLAPLAPCSDALLQGGSRESLHDLPRGLAFTITTLPKTSLLPAFVAGFVRTFNLHKPGRENRPILPTSFVAILAKLPRAFEHTDFFSPHEVASASAIAP